MKTRTCEFLMTIALVMGVVLSACSAPSGDSGGSSPAAAAPAAATPAPATPPSVVQVATGTNFSVVLKSDGSLWTFGSNQYWTLGVGTTTTSSTIPLQVAGSWSYVAASKGDGSVLAIKSGSEKV